MNSYEPNKKDMFLAAHEKAVREFHADYEIVKQTRTDIGISVPTYEEWLESELELYKSLVSFYRGKSKV